MAIPDESVQTDTVDGRKTVAEGNASDLKKKTARGALVSVAGQAMSFTLRFASMVVVARLVKPEEFGIVGKVTAFTGILGLFKDAGLSMAMIQRDQITNEQKSTLFWINLAFGLLLGLVCIALAPLLTALYAEPRLFWITIAIGSSFVFYGAAAQHRALLQREMRFTALATIDLLSLFISAAASIVAALMGLGHWALVIMAVGLSISAGVFTWFLTGWMPGLPRKSAGVGSMLRYGGTLSLNGVIVYVAYNAEKVLLGKFWGAEVLGLYGRAYQLISLPTENLNSTIGQVAFPALSRVQNEPDRLRSYFLKGYSVFLSLIIPITMSFEIFAADIVRLFLGPQWDQATGVFRFLAPTIFVFAMINPFAWLMMATGNTARSLKIALMIAPTVFIGYLAGLKHGAEGVAIGYSCAMLLVTAPMIIWAKHGTLITNRDVATAVLRPITSALIGAIAAFAMSGYLSKITQVFVRLVAENLVLFSVYLFVLLIVMRQKSVYVQLFHDTGFRRHASQA
jgi:PST family polysaccharide transporter